MQNLCPRALMTVSTASDALRCVLDVKASLGECPTWSVAEQALYWVDINAPSLNRFDPRPAEHRDADARVDRLLRAAPFRRFRGCAPRRHLARAARRHAAAQVAPAPYDPIHHRFNDGRCDPRGRLLAGTMNEKRDAATGRSLSARMPITR
jgi:sugar lactone lactonase YvrE